MAVVVCTACWAPRHRLMLQSVKIGDMTDISCPACKPVWVKYKQQPHVIVATHMYITDSMTIREMHEYQAMAKLIVT